MVAGCCGVYCSLRSGAVLLNYVQGVPRPLHYPVTHPKYPLSRNTGSINGHLRGADKVSGLGFGPAADEYEPQHDHLMERRACTPKTCNQKCIAMTKAKKH